MAPSADEVLHYIYGKSNPLLFLANTILLSLLLLVFCSFFRSHKRQLDLVSNGRRSPDSQLTKITIKKESLRKNEKGTHGVSHKVSEKNPGNNTLNAVSALKETTASDQNNDPNNLPHDFKSRALPPPPKRDMPLGSEPAQEILEDPLYATVTQSQPKEVEVSSQVEPTKESQDIIVGNKGGETTRNEEIKDVKIGSPDPLYSKVNRKNKQSVKRQEQKDLENNLDKPITEEIPQETINTMTTNNQDVKATTHSSHSPTGLDKDT
ncbi:Hypothetical predicted protein [Pelobates cultripes]|uniref:Uncharacterized protein n=1 Tax=Pelobates cultripes TaxID=61616 RepID=A0AAD1R900_PELCU|nr:Hypothetical predicted protein [Pelobates cultripes]